MSRFSRQFSFALVLVATLGARAVAQPQRLEPQRLESPRLEPPRLESSSFQSPSLEPQHGVLALRSGGVIEGRYSKLGDQYVVVVSGGEIRIDADKVEVACRSIEQAYQAKRAAMSQHSVSAHLRLAQWCMRQKLFEQAAGEINTARGIDDRDRRIAMVERRMQALRQQQATARKTTSQPAPAPDHGELDRWLGGLPRGSVEQFANSIQPLLSNRCATGACHGPTSNRADVHVLRVPRGRAISRRATARNLREVMKWVDRDQPNESPLLAVPTRPHANAEAAIFATSGDEQYRRLVSWVYSLSQQPAGTTPSRSGQEVARPFADAPVMRSPWGTASPLLQPAPVPWRQTPRASPWRTPVHHALAERHQQLEAATAAGEGTPAALAEVPGDERPNARTQGPHARTQGKGGSARGAGVPANGPVPFDGYVPVDEFDPEIFNRRHPEPVTDEP